jgi:hypothetical protein
VDGPSARRARVIGLPHPHPHARRTAVLGDEVDAGSTVALTAAASLSRARGATARALPLRDFILFQPYRGVMVNVAALRRITSHGQTLHNRGASFRAGEVRRRRKRFRANLKVAARGPRHFSVRWPIHQTATEVAHRGGQRPQKKPAGGIALVAEGSVLACPLAPVRNLAAAPPLGDEPVRPASRHKVPRRSSVSPSGPLRRRSPDAPLAMPADAVICAAEDQLNVAMDAFKRVCPLPRERRCLRTATPRAAPPSALSPAPRRSRCCPPPPTPATRLPRASRSP